MTTARRLHWPEYLLEALGLGLFMLAAALGGTLLFHPASPAVAALPDPDRRLLLMGIAMGATAIALIGSPIGKRSGAHMNPATTLTFWRLGKIAGADAVGYLIGQTLGGIAGLALAWAILGDRLAAPGVDFVVTRPGPAGAPLAFGVEFAMALVLMSVVLRVSQSRRWNHLTGVCAGTLVALYIRFCAPISGMSLNPARTLASAVLARDATALWVYLTAPVLGMFVAAELFVRGRGLRAVLCGKLHHGGAHRCIFRCSFGMDPGAPGACTGADAGESPALQSWTTTTSS